MSLTRFLPHEVRSNVAGAIYGVILGSSIIAAAGADHPRQAGLVEIYLCVTALVFYLATASWGDSGRPRDVRVSPGRSRDVAIGIALGAFTLSWQGQNTKRDRAA
jgi:hypothetical protein